MKLIVAGATGVVGRHLVPALRLAGHEPIVLSRNRAARLPGTRVVWWDGQSLDGDWPAELAEAGGIVNLAGASVDRRWTKRRKRSILASRVESTRALVEAIRRLPAERRPRVLVTASGIDWAGDTGEQEVTETAPSGSSFLASVC